MPERAERILPAHIEETIDAIAKLQAEHNEKASDLQKMADRITGSIGRPITLIYITAFCAAWIALNHALAAWGFSLDPPPYDFLQGMTSVAGLYVTVIILATQRYSDRLASYREQLTLELSILAEQKSAKIIELLEEQRRDNPLMKDRRDPQAEVMADATDPEQVLEAIVEAQDNENED